MDQWHAIAGLVGFSAGFWLRGQSEAKVDPPACHCQCQWSGAPIVEHNVSGQSSSLSGILLAIAVVTVVVLSNVALVCKVTLRESSSGTAREFQVNIKGKSKGQGVHGAARGLAITG
jgi:hypothetical protein